MLNDEYDAQVAEQLFFTIVSKTPVEGPSAKTRRLETLHLSKILGPDRYDIIAWKAISPHVKISCVGSYVGRVLA